MSEHNEHVSDHDGHAPNSVPEKWRKLILRLFWAGCAILVLLDVTKIIYRHKEHSLESVPAFYALYGFLGVGGLIVLSIGLRRLVMRPEDYYDAE